MARLIAPSILSGDFLNLQSDVDLINRSDADWFHIDVMDGVFVPNISFGFPVMDAVAKAAIKPLDVHLMIVKPDAYVARFAEAGAHIITVHYEACEHLHRSVELIRSHSCKAGVAINPHSPVHLLEDIIAELDLVLVMSVNPGFGGQKFIQNTFDKVRATRELIERKGSNALIEVDGGVNASNASELYECGADVLVAGNAVFGATSPENAISRIKGAKLAS